MEAFSFSMLAILTATRCHYRYKALRPSPTYSETPSNSSRGFSDAAVVDAL
jgi:hypothetical protein